MSNQQTDRLHPIVDFAQRLTAGLDALAQMPMSRLSERDRREVLEQLEKIEAQLEMLQLRLTGRGRALRGDRPQGT